jgi:hypothetical protein
MIGIQPAVDCRNCNMQVFGAKCAFCHCPIAGPHWPRVDEIIERRAQEAKDEIRRKVGKAKMAVMEICDPLLRQQNRAMRQYRKNLDEVHEHVLAIRRAKGRL